MCNAPTPTSPPPTHTHLFPPLQPDLVLVPGEDLTPYRKASASVFSVLSEFGTAAQKLGMDEVCITVHRLLRQFSNLSAVF